MEPADFYYELPDRLIARYPAQPRSASRLVCVGAAGDLEDQHFVDLPSQLRAGDRLVFNDTRVLLARLYGQKETGGKVELLLERVTGASTAMAQIRASHAPKAGGRLSVKDRDGRRYASATIESRDGRFFLLRFDTALDAVMQACGHVPLPPYIDREDELSDQQRYQTVYAKKDGAVAAPTAGLHFDDGVLSALSSAGIDCSYVTLHVGAGTFQPLSEAQLATNRLHAERIIVDEALCEQINETRRQGGRIVCVGTTSLRALESAARDGVLRPMDGETDLFIRPGYAFQVVDGLVTNFHLPGSSLMMLVSAFAGVDEIRRIYAHAISQEYRFFSYGDAMLLWRQADEGVSP